MFFLRQLKKFRVNKTILNQFYRAVTESVLTFSITVWFGSVLTFSITVSFGSASIHNKNMLEGIVKTASKITGSKLPSIESIYRTRTLRKATTIISDCTHPANHLFESLPSGKRFRSKLELHALVTVSTQKQLNQTTQHQIKRIGREEGRKERKKERKKERRKKKIGGGGGGREKDKAESLVKVVYTCTINYPPPQLSQLLIFGTGTVVVTNPVKVVLVI